MNLEARPNVSEATPSGDYCEIDELVLQGTDQQFTSETVAHDFVERPVGLRGGSQQDVQECSRFDYACLGEDAEAIRAATARIHDRHGGMVLNAIEIGKELLSIKEKLPHGKFGIWLNAEFGWTERTAQHLMNAAREFGDNPSLVKSLLPTALYKLSARGTPQEVKAKILDELAAGLVPTAAEIQARIETSRQSKVSRLRRKAAENDRSMPNAPAQKGSATNAKKGDHLAASLAGVLVTQFGPKSFMRFQAKLQPVGQQFLAAIQAIDPSKAQELHEQWCAKREKAQLDQSGEAEAAD